MAKSKPSGASSKVVLSLLIIGVLGIAALAAYVKFGTGEKLPQDLKKPPATTVLPNSGDVDNVQVIKPHAKGPDITFSHGEKNVPAGGDAIVTSVNGFLEQCPFVPKDARALSADVKDGIAKIEFSNSFETSYGTTDEEALLQGLQRSLGQFKDVDKIIFAIGGKPIDSLGNVELKDGITVIRPDQSAPATPSGTPPSPTQG